MITEFHPWFSEVFEASKSLVKRRRLVHPRLGVDPSCRPRPSDRHR